MRRTGLVLLVLLASCSSAVPATNDGVLALRGGSFDLIPEMRQVRSRVPISNVDASFVMEVEGRLVVECMKRRGFPEAEDLWAPARPAVPQPPRYLSPSSLRRAGYETDWAATAKGLVDSFLAGKSDGLSTMNPARRQAYGVALSGGRQLEPTREIADLGGGTVGVITKGCTGEASLAVNGTGLNGVRFYRLYEQILDGGLLAKQLQRRARYRAAVSRWQTCMREAGIAVTSQADYGASYVDETNRANLRALKSILTSVETKHVSDSDAACQERSGLFVVRKALLPKAQVEAANALGLKYGDMVVAEQAILLRAKRLA